MDDMQFAKYAVDIREILEHLLEMQLLMQFQIIAARQIGLHKNCL